MIQDTRRFPIRFASLAGFVLAGGASTRMGRPKASLLLDGQSMLERQIRLLRSVARTVGVVGGPAGYSADCDVSHAADAVTGRGPLAGIYTALLETRTEFNLVLGCDLPFVNRRLLSHIAVCAVTGGSDVTVPRSRDGRLQPLCAVYRRRALYAIRRNLEGGENSPRSLFPKVCCNVIAWSDLACAGFLSLVFSNMNTPADYEYARRRLEESARTPA